MSITLTSKDAYGRVNLSAPIGGLSYTWSKSKSGGSYVEIPQFTTQVITDNRPTCNWISLSWSGTSVLTGTFTGDSLLFFCSMNYNQPMTVELTGPVNKTYNFVGAVQREGVHFEYEPFFGIQGIPYGTYSFSITLTPYVYNGNTYYNPAISRILARNFNASYQEDITYKCVITGGANAGTHYLTVDPSIDRQASVTATIEKFLPYLEAQDWWTDYSENICTVAAMYIMATDLTQKSRLLNVAATKVRLTGLTGNTERIGYCAYFAYRIFKNVVGAETLITTLQSLIEDFMTTYAYQTSSQLATVVTGATNWKTPIWFGLILISSDPDFTNWYGNTTLHENVLAALDLSQDQSYGNMMIGTDGNQPYHCNGVSQYTDSTNIFNYEWTLSYALFAYQHLKYLSETLGWRSTTLAKASKWLADFSIFTNPQAVQPLDEGFFFWDVEYGGQEPVSVLQRIQAYYQTYGNVSSDFVDALYSAAFDANTYVFNVTEGGNPEWDWGNPKFYDPQGLDPSTELYNPQYEVFVDTSMETTTTLFYNSQNWHIFYAVHGLLFANNIPSSEWAWEGLTLTPLTAGSFTTASIVLQPEISPPTLNTGEAGSFVVPTIFVMPDIPVVNIVGISSGSFLLDLVLLQPYILSASFDGVAVGNFDLPTVTLRPVIAPLALDGAVSGSFDLPLVVPVPLVNPPSLVGVASGTSIRAPDMSVLDLRDVNLQPITLRFVA